MCLTRRRRSECPLCGAVIGESTDAENGAQASEAAGADQRARPRPCASQWRSADLRLPASSPIWCCMGAAARPCRRARTSVAVPRSRRTTVRAKASRCRPPSTTVEPPPAKPAPPPRSQEQPTDAGAAQPSLPAVERAAINAKYKSLACASRKGSRGRADFPAAPPATAPTPMEAWCRSYRRRPAPLSGCGASRSLEQ